MKKLTTLVLLLGSLLLAGCSLIEEETPAPETIEVDIDATVEAAIEAYLKANPTTVTETETIVDINSFNDALVELVDQVDSSTLFVINLDDLGEPDSSGSAVVYKEEAGYYYAVTNNHVVEGNNGMRVYFQDYSFVDAEVVGTDSETDLAVIKFSTDLEQEITVSSFGDINELVRGQVVVAVGSPGGYYNSATMGMISGLERFVGIDDLDGDGIDDVFVKMLQHDAAINPGNSGGPLFNLDGEIIGINTIKLVSDDIEGMGFSLYVDVVQRVIQDLEEYGEVQRTRLGVWIMDVRFATDAPEGVDLGVLVQEVITDGPIDSTSDLEDGDVIVEFGGVSIDGVDRLKDVIFQYYPGDEVEFKYFRDGEVYTTSVVLGEKD